MRHRKTNSMRVLTRVMNHAKHEAILAVWVKTVGKVRVTPRSASPTSIRVGELARRLATIT